ncbi:hypothetical protein NDU88_002004 [Pleurodeles waltl]|uniref:Uncharacterized protein n=1 Tax=Pleurodeles waltl TaxID=8319 RepID=A0AAV7P8Q4_PLEWA|nr:hypothetical protein NDU88_002004 [Pleurodeles waltl]
MDLSPLVVLPDAVNGPSVSQSLTLLTLRTPGAVVQQVPLTNICWQAKPIDEVLQYAKYWSDEIELKEKKLKEKAMVMQIKAPQTGVQGAFVQQMPQPQPQGTVMFQPQEMWDTGSGSVR